MQLLATIFSRFLDIYRKLECTQECSRNVPNACNIQKYKKQQNIYYDVQQVKCISLHTFIKIQEYSLIMRIENIIGNKFSYIIPYFSKERDLLKFVFCYQDISFFNLKCKSRPCIFKAVEKDEFNSNLVIRNITSSYINWWVICKLNQICMCESILCLSNVICYL